MPSVLSFISLPVITGHSTQVSSFLASSRCPTSFRLAQNRRITINLSMSLVFALDFDGVLCDSVNESSVTAFRAAKSVWPSLHVPTDESETPVQELLSAMRKVRPVIETGFENVLLARLAAEANDVEKDFVQPILDGWPDIRKQVMADWAVEKEKLVDVFGATRDQWIDKDIDAWIQTNAMFPQVVDAVNNATGDVYIITTKQRRFCLLLLERYGITNVNEDNVYAFGTGSKISVLKKILAMKENEGKKLMFLEDRYETLEAVSISMLGQPLELFLAAWGYNTEKTRATASKHPFIKVMELPQFIDKLKQ